MYLLTWRCGMKTVCVVAGDAGGKWEHNSSSDSWKRIKSTQSLWWRKRPINGEWNIGLKCATSGNCNTVNCSEHWTEMCNIWQLQYSELFWTLDWNVQHLATGIQWTVLNIGLKCATSGNCNTVNCSEHWTKMCNIWQLHYSELFWTQISYSLV